jgi:hypothetical protein
MNLKSPNTLKTLRLKHHGHLPIFSNNTPRSKALESVCLFRFSPSAHCDTVSKGRGEGEGHLINSFFYDNLSIKNIFDQEATVN